MKNVLVVLTDEHVITVFKQKCCGEYGYVVEADNCREYNESKGVTYNTGNLLAGN
jgi:hypothetical protein